MAIRKVARLGHPVLRKRARDLSKHELETDYVKDLIRDMIETMQEYGGIGLAAPQVHESVRMCIIDLSSAEDRYPESSNGVDEGLGVYINPVIRPLDLAEQGYWEGCLSVPEMRGLVYRPRAIEIQYFNEKGEEKSRRAEGFLATVFQHEFDHLDGVLYVDRLKDTRQFAFVDEYRRYWLTPAADEPSLEEP